MLFELPPTANASRQSPASLLLFQSQGFHFYWWPLSMLPIPLLQVSESLFSIILIWNFITLIWICVLQTSGGPPGSLLASTCYSAGNLCSRLWSGPAFWSWPDAHIQTAQAAPPLPPSPPRRGFPGPQAPKRSEDYCDQKRSWFYLGIKTLEEESNKDKELGR